MPLVFATDCTGIDAPLHCIKSILKNDEQIRYAFASDINPRVRSFLKTMNPVPEIIYDNISVRCNNENFQDVDLYVAGFPCQSFSTLGKRQGLSSPEGCVFWKILDFLQKAQPKVFLLENVKQLLAHNKGETFRIIMQHLQSMPFYHIDYKILSPIDIKFPQRRPRVFILGTHAVKFGQPVTWPRLAPVDCSLESLLLTKEQAQNLQPSCCRPLACLPQKNLECIANAGIDLNKTWIVDLSPSLAFSIKPKVGECPCLKRNNQMFYISTQKRYITYRETLRLQGFDDSIFENVAFQRGELCRSDIHAFAGNSMCIPLIRTILEPVLAGLLGT